MIVVACEQRSPEWYAARLGRLTSSCAAEAFAKIRSGEAASRRNLRTRLVLERLTGQSQENGYQSFDMERGIALEADARAVYEGQTGVIVETVGCLQHDTLLAACSPDGLIGDDGIVELKVPKAATHLEYLRGGLPAEYLLQITHTLWITGRAWGDFASYAPDFPTYARLKVTRIRAADLDLAAHELAVRLFLSECDREYEEVARLGLTTV